LLQEPPHGLSAADGLPLYGHTTRFFTMCHQQCPAEPSTGSTLASCRVAVAPARGWYPLWWR